VRIVHLRGLSQNHDAHWAFVWVRIAETREEPATTGKRNESVKVFLRNTQTGWYYVGPSNWTPEQGAAYDLGQVARAVEHIFEAHLENVEILLSYDDPRYDLVLPVPPSPSRGERPAASQPGQESPFGEHGRADLRSKKVTGL
jgi:hypothetical protein